MIQVFSNFANDEIVYENSRIIPGWPALWISNTFDNLNTWYHLQTGNEPAIVKIDKDSHGEDKGSIVFTPSIPYRLDTKSELILISTLKNEFDLSLLSNNQLPVCIDIQGFLRGENGEKKQFDCNTIQTKWSVYIKATREEFSYINNDAETGFTFIITDGGGDIEVLQWNNHYFVPIQRKKFQDTIGAGDTFFAAFCSYLLESDSTKTAIQRASLFVHWFLVQKNKSQSN